MEFMVLVEAWVEAPWTIGRIVIGSVFLFWVLLVAALVGGYARRFRRKASIWRR